MGLRRTLARLAATAPAPVFAVSGPSQCDAIRRLRLDSRVEVVPTPRQATVLLVAGDIPPALEHVLALVHDQMPAPRTTLRWRDGDGDCGAAVAELWRSLLAGTVGSESDWLPDVDPVPWRGVGPYGQGGTGMTGGVPYGRPLAGRGPDRDRLELDQVSARIGPLFPAFPVGLVLDVKLQGDVVQEAAVVASADWPVPSDVFHEAANGAVTVAALETARARHHLRWLADALRVAGRPALGLRALAAAEAAEIDLETVEVLARRVWRDPGLWASGRGVGLVASRPGLGPVSRAAGLADDARRDDDAYRQLGFAPVVRAEGDVRARWLQRVDESRQSVQLAARAGASVVDPAHVEGLRGPVTGDGESRLLDLLAASIVGLEWGDAVATIVSLDPQPVAEPAVTGATP